MKRVALTLSVLILAGCSPAAPEPAPTPTPTPESATPEQVASVLAAYESDWRATIDGAVDCRFLWTFSETIQDEIQGTTCWLDEQTIGITAGLVTRDWEGMKIPSSMSDLVAKTSAILTLINEDDLKTICGADSVPVDTDECNKALGGRNFLYTQLESQLDAWKPYF